MKPDDLERMKRLETALRFVEHTSTKSAFITAEEAKLCADAVLSLISALQASEADNERLRGELAEAIQLLRQMRKNHRHFRENTSGNQADAYYTFIKGEDGFWSALTDFLNRQALEPHHEP